jgi:hypothetical protein
MDELDQAIASGDPNKIAAALKKSLLKGDTRAMEKFRRLSSAMEVQVANSLLLSLDSSELSQLSNASASQQAMNELSSLRK